MKSKLYLGFLLISLIGLGLLIFGIIHNTADRSNFIETEAIVHGVSIRDGDHGSEYRPNMLVFKDENGNTHSVSCGVWFNRPLFEGDTVTILYKKDDPGYTIVSNVDKDTTSYAFMGLGGVLIVAGIVLTGKYLYDVKHGKKV